MDAKIEMRIYEVLGVKLFRKLVFILEKFIHYKDKGVNINYHIPAKEVSALDAFIKYLFYNGSIHVRNLIVFALYCLLKVLFQWKFQIYDVALCLLALKDLYCVFLQRYNLLRIRLYKKMLEERLERKRAKNIERIKRQFSNSYDFSFAQSDLALVKKLKTCIENRESIILSEENIIALNRLLSANNASRIV